MWRPIDVVPEHKKRAIVVWTLLLLGIVAYTAWQIVELGGKFDNPSTSISMSDDLYPFPTFKVCMPSGFGCDARLNGSTCVKSVRYNVTDSCGDQVKDMQIPNKHDDCISFYLSTMDLKAFDGRCKEYVDKPLVTVRMKWCSSFDTFNKDDYSEAVVVHLGDGPNVAHVKVPYTHSVKSPGNTSASPTFIHAEMTISKVTRNFISGDSRTKYPVLNLSTANQVHQTATDTYGYTDEGIVHQDLTSDTDDDSLCHNTTSDTHGNSSYAFGYLDVTLIQGAFSVTEISDINPFDLGDFLGNIGGFWELLQVIWGICFVGTRLKSTTYRGRDFTQPVRVGKDIAGLTRRSSTQTLTSGEQGWDDEQRRQTTAKRSRREAPADNIHVMTPV